MTYSDWLTDYKFVENPTSATQVAVFDHDLRGDMNKIRRVYPPKRLGNTTLWPIELAVEWAEGLHRRWDSRVLICNPETHEVIQYFRL